MKKLSKLLLILILILSFNGNIVKAEDTYTLKVVFNDITFELGSYSNASDAIKGFNDTFDIYDNLLLYKNNTLVKAKYGVVGFNSDDNCELSVSYYSQIDYENKDLNACYASDGAYLGSSDDLETVYFEVAGDIGYTSIDNVTIYPYSSDITISNYTVEGGYLYHNIKKSMENSIYRNSNKIDLAPSYLKENQIYYSYDNHYFYSSYKTMINDYINNTYENSLNYDEPYYNYYQYVTLRSLTNYTLDEIESFFNNDLLISSRLTGYIDNNQDNGNDIVNESELYGNYNSFFMYQNIYGVNALELLSIACVDSGYGKSYNAYYKNNLYTKNAYDTIKETDNKAFDNIESSIGNFARYIIGRYSDYSKKEYDGLFIGDYINGFASNYSEDPYYGEKVAAVYFMIDSSLNYKDLNSKALGISNSKSVIVYSDSDLTKQLYTIDATGTYSFTILEELDKAYKIQLDSTSEQYGQYDFVSQVAYINKDSVSTILNANNIKEDEYININFELGEGSISKLNNITIKYRKNDTPIISNIDYDGYDFIGFDCKLETVNEEKTYIANYQKIDNLTIFDNKNTSFIKGEGLISKDILLSLNNEDSSIKLINLNSDNIRNYKDIDSSSEVNVEYRGLTTTYTYTYNEEESNYIEELKKRVDELITSFENNEELNKEDVDDLKLELSEHEVLLTSSQIEKLDSIILSLYEDNKYIIYDDDLGISISGFGLSLPYQEESEPLDTYYAYVTSSSHNFDKIINFANKFGLKVEEKINVSFKFNLVDLNTINPFLVKYKIDGNENKIYTVYYEDDNGNIVKLNTTQNKDYVSFIAPNNNDYIIMSSYSENVYDANGNKGNINNDNSSLDYIKSYGYIFIVSLEIIYIILSIILLLRTRKNQEKYFNNERNNLN